MGKILPPEKKNFIEFLTQRNFHLPVSTAYCVDSEHIKGLFSDYVDSEHIKGLFSDCFDSEHIKGLLSDYVDSEHIKRMFSYCV